MTPEQFFSAANMLVLPFWLLLAVAPRWRPGSQVLAPVVAPVLLGIAYALAIVPQLGGDGGFGSISSVREAFANDFVLLAGWIHYLAFDLFVGSWEARDSQRVGIPQWALIPCLALTLMLGPIGLLCYLVLRMGWKRNWSVEV